MSKVKAIQVIVKLYFFAALGVSFMHLVHAGAKGGLGGERWMVPFMVDGIAVIGMIMRSEEFAQRTRKIGFRVQLVAGVLSLAGNIYAAGNTGGMVLGVGVVALFIAAEWIGDQIESAQAEAVAAAQAEAEAKKAASIAKGKATRARNTRTRKTQATALASLLNA